MTDYRQLLKDAATAAGYVWNVHIEKEREKSRIAGLWIVGISTDWNPIEDDGDALRLLTKLRLSIIDDDDPEDDFVRCFGRRKCDVIEERRGRDPEAATRLAIVRAAAELGKRAVPPHDGNLRGNEEGDGRGK